MKTRHRPVIPETENPPHCRSSPRQHKQGQRQDQRHRTTVSATEETISAERRVEWAGERSHPHPELIMIKRPNGTALLVVLSIAATAAAARLGAQTVDSTHRWSLFGGRAATESRGPENGYELGASGDFRWGPVPAPLRFSLSFSQASRPTPYASDKGGKASLDLVMRPFPRKFGLQPYFLAGLGMATRSGVDFWNDGYYFIPGVTPAGPSHYVQPRQTWAFASAGMGLDIGRAFIQLKLENPVASHGPVVVPLNIGFRFWD
jgi:hypothetical protein